MLDWMMTFPLRKNVACPCGCGLQAVNPRLLVALHYLESELGDMLDLTSVCRCKAYNTSIGGAKESQHLVGSAADIACLGLDPDDLAAAAKRVLEFRNGGIGLYDKHVHVDVRHGPARWDLRS